MIKVTAKARPNAGETTVSFVSADFDSTSDEILVPIGAIVILIPSGNQYQIYDPKVIAHQGEWTLNGVKQPPPVFYENATGVKAVRGGSVVIQKFAGGFTIETHMHQWYVKSNGSPVNPAILACQHKYGDNVLCDVEATTYGFVQGWGARYYRREVTR